MNILKKTCSMKAYAKVNLVLDILGKMENGYHRLDMIMQQVALADEVSLTMLTKEEKNTFEGQGVPVLNTVFPVFLKMECAGGGIVGSGMAGSGKPDLEGGGAGSGKSGDSAAGGHMELLEPEKNIACRAVKCCLEREFEGKCGRHFEVGRGSEFEGKQGGDFEGWAKRDFEGKCGRDFEGRHGEGAEGKCDAVFRAENGTGVEACAALLLEIKKNIPVAAGLAGGSTDAAAALILTNQLFGLGMDLAGLMEIGVGLGADVPYCILGGTARAEGIGEKLTKLPSLKKGHFLLVKPDVSVSTAWAYQTYDKKFSNKHYNIEEMISTLKESSQDIRKISGHLGNVLELATIPEYPQIEEIKGEMRQRGALGVLMSGSGPTVFGIYEEEEGAKRAADAFKKDGYREVFAVRPVGVGNL